MSNIADFLLDRIAEDEAVAHAAIEDDCNQDGGFEDAYSALTGQKGSPLDFVPRFGRAAAALITLTAVPRRVLAECEAKRRIVRAHSRYDVPQELTAGTIWACETCGDVDDSPTEWPCQTIRYIAVPYADHPDYRGEWKP